MAKKSSKQANVQQVTMTLSGGLNYSQSPGNIADNELQRCRNFIYDPETDYLVTRPGTTCQTAASLPAPITASCYYEISATEAYHVAAAGKKLYFLSGTDLDEWTEIGTNLLTGNYPPSFLVFNSLLLIADGDTHIKSWAGAITGTISTGITDSPPASALAEIGNRVVANSITDLDLVTLSAPEDATATGWNTATTAIGLRVGFGDLLPVNGFAVFGDDLIISKKGDRTKRIYRLNVGNVDPGSWYVKDLSRNNAAQNNRAIVSAWNNVFFADTNGFKSVKGTDTYGDLTVDAVGRKINPAFGINAVCDFVTYLPTYNAIWFNIGAKCFCYTERYDPQSGSNLPAFTEIYFGWGRCTSIYQAGGDVYLTGYNGFVYKLDESVSTDEITPGVLLTFPSYVRGKTFTFFGDGILRKLQFYLTPKLAGGGIINVCMDENTKVAVATFSAGGEGQYLYDATGYFSDTEITPPTELMPNQVDRDFSGASAWAKVDVNAYDETTDLTMTANAVGQYCTCPVASAPTTIGTGYRMSFVVANLVGRWIIQSYDGTQTIGTVTVTGAQNFHWRATTTGGYRIVAVDATSSGDFDNFALSDLATGVYNDITGYLYDAGSSPWTLSTRNRIRNDEMAFELELTSGRCGVEWCKAEIALVEGGG